MGREPPPVDDDGGGAAGAVAVPEAATRASQSKPPSVPLIERPARAVAAALGAWAAVVARRPWHVIVAAVCASVLLSTGMLLLRSETKSDRLWVPQGTAVMRSSRLVRESAGTELNFWSWIALATTEASSDDPGVLTPAAVSEMYAFDAVVTSVDGYGELCVRNAEGGCLAPGVLELWCGRDAFEREVLDADDPQEALLDRINSGQGCGGRETYTELLLGASVIDEASGKVVRAHATRMTYLMTTDALGEASEAFRVAMAAFKEEHEADGAHATELLYEYFEAYDLEVSRSSSRDLPLVSVSFVLTFGLMAAAHIDWRARAAGTRPQHRVGVTSCAVVSVALAIFAAYGITGFLGVTFTSLSQVVAFVLVGVGVDDSVVLLGYMRAANKAHPGAPLEVRMKDVMQHAGASVTVTSLTNFFAFSLGSLSQIPAIRWFCYSASVAILCDYVLQLTFFVACMAVAERREDARAASPETLGSSTMVQPESDARDVEGGARASEVVVANGGGDAAGQVGDKGARPGLGRRALGVLLSAPARALIVAAFAAFVAYSGVGIGSLKEGLPLADLAADGTFLRDFLLAEEALFSAESGVYTGLYFYRVDLSPPHAQAAALASWKVVSADEYVDAANTPTSNWLTETLLVAEATGNTVRCADALAAIDTSEGGASGAALCEAAGGADTLLVSSSDAFYASLETVLKNDPRRADHVSLASDGTTGLVKLPLTFVTSKEDVRLKILIYRRMDSMRQLLHEAFFDLPGLRVDVLRDDVFAYSEYMVFASTESILWGELTRNMLLAGGGVAVASMLLLPRPTAVLLGVAAVACVDMMLFGLMALEGVRFNSISVVNLVMAVGLAVDYSIHVLHAFVQTPGNSLVARAEVTLRTIGPSVALGGLTTFVGILPLAGSRSTIFRTFFTMLSGTVGFGLLVALVLLPALLSVMGPAHVPGADPHAARAGRVGGSATGGVKL